MKGVNPQGSAFKTLAMSIYMTPVEVAYKLNCKLQFISSWLADNRMQINVKKSSVMWFSTTQCRNSQPFPDIKFENITLSTVLLTDKNILG